jgi:hypothetical protein
MKDFINLGEWYLERLTGISKYYKAAAIYGGNVRYGTVGEGKEGQKKWYLCLWGGFDRNMVGAYWFIDGAYWDSFMIPGLREKFLKEVKKIGGEIHTPLTWEEYRKGGKKC